MVHIIRGVLRLPHHDAGLTGGVCKILIENFEPRRVRNPFLRWLMQVTGAADPDGKAPIDMQLSFIGRRSELRKAAERMLGWAPEKIILSHGRCYDTNGAAELKRAFRWIL